MASHGRFSAHLQLEKRHWGGKGHTEKKKPEVSHFLHHRDTI